MVLLLAENLLLPLLLSVLAVILSELLRGIIARDAVEGPAALLTLPQPSEPFSPCTHRRQMPLPEDLFLNFALTALQTTHAHLVITAGEASRYPAAVAPFAAISTPTKKALSDLRELIAPDEYVWATALGEADPADAQLKIETTIDVLQMILPPDIELPQPNPGILPLDCSHAAEMVALTDIAFPGFFRPRTCEMGRYFGVRSTEADELIAMGGERIVFPGYSEMSGLCTHPEHRGKGYAAHLLRHLAALHRAQGIVSWLHVTATNSTAVNLYLKLGFQTVRSIKLHRLGCA